MRTYGNDMSTHVAEGAADHPRPAAPVCHAAGEVAPPEATVEMEIVHLLEGGQAVARSAAGTEEISVAQVDVSVGDTVLVKAGEAIAVV